MAVAASMIPKAAMPGFIFRSFSSWEPKAMFDSIGKEKSAHQDREQYRGHDGGDLGSGRLSDPERTLGNDMAFDQDCFHDEIKDETQGDSEQDQFGLSRKSNRILDLGSEKKSQGDPDETVDQRSHHICREEAEKRHSGSAGGEEDDGPQAVQISGNEEKAVPIAAEGILDLVHLRGRKDFPQETMALERAPEKHSEAVQDGVGNDDPRERGAHHPRESRYSLIDEKPRNQEDDLFGRARAEGAEEQQEENTEVGAALEVLGHHVERGTGQLLDRRRGDHGHLDEVLSAGRRSIMPRAG